MYDVAVVKASEHVKDCIGLTDVGEKLVSKSFSLAGSLHETGDVHDVNSGRDNALRLAHVRKHLQPLVRNVRRAEVRLYRAERKIGALGLARAHAVEQS